MLHRLQVTDTSQHQLFTGDSVDQAFMVKLLQRNDYQRRSNKKRRLSWTKKHKQWTLDHWKSVLWSDESNLRFSVPTTVFVRYFDLFNPFLVTTWFHMCYFIVFMSSLLFYNVENSKNKEKPLNRCVQNSDWYWLLPANRNPCLCTLKCVCVCALRVCVCVFNIPSPWLSRGSWFLKFSICGSSMPLD